MASGTYRDAGRRITKYKTYLSFTNAHLYISSVSELVEMLREQGYPEIDFSPDKIPVGVWVTWEVGDPEGIADLWDLRDIVEEVNANLSSYSLGPIAKPEEVVGDA